MTSFEEDLHTFNEQSLRVAVESRDCVRIGILSDFGVNIDIVTAHGWYAMGYAARHGFDDVITTLLALGSKMLNGPRQCRSPLEHAIVGNHERTVTLLVTHGANINSVNVRGETLYTVAIYCGHPRIADLLVELGYQTIGEPQTVTPLSQLAFCASMQHVIKL